METATMKKMRGGYYTPRELTDFIVSWCIKDKSDKILEPSAGDGEFVRSAIKKLETLENFSPESNILAVEYDKNEEEKIPLKSSSKRNADFFEVFNDELLDEKEFDVLLGNPPFIRYQNFDERSRQLAFDSMQTFGFSPNRMTNIWVPFLLLSIQLLKQDGRLGMVIPAELLQVDYAQEAREYLINFFDELIVLTFEENIFDGAQQEVVVLLGRKSSKEKGMKLIELSSIEDLNNLNVDSKKYEIKHTVGTTEKWLKFFLSEPEISNFETLIQTPGLSSLNDRIEVNVGVVTGQNKFFVIDKETVENFNLDKSTIDIISRAEQIRGFRLTQENLLDLYERNKKVKLFYPTVLTNGDKQYISEGEKLEYDQGYKTKIRKNWYEVPISWSPEAFFLRQVHEFPRIIINDTNATNTDTLHKIRVRGDEKIEEIAVLFLNSLTLLQCELMGRSYGGGVLTFEPGEVRQLVIPLVHLDPSFINEVERLVDDNRVSEAVKLVDNNVLIDRLGFSVNNVDLLSQSREKLLNRRLSRKKKK